MNSGSLPDLTAAHISIVFSDSNRSGVALIEGCLFDAIRRATSFVGGINNERHLTVPEPEEWRIDTKTTTTMKKIDAAIQVVASQEII